ncbi:uncharacterized protein MONBRDRAFT_26201 [Monosiga brevicollis MX1]|uniref:Uncharacterized protein n=1 Tax=Monosiga brevicollis TaxID=81824 RepID=A9V1N1_MONBE|nr:uncharacterized protein MONBRDRAFT_26201 [Monosiga brevicollis MX1]EDQ88470.1 predicted protein [Monosiga brevicollis MX1]|eukprot:XP_001746574.1 hypothetical protein [Monosiga brevicollis MX1]
MSHATRVLAQVWIGGSADNAGAGHERGPYWLNGMVSLVAQLNASGSPLAVNVSQQVNQWIYHILDNQSADGWLGPHDDDSISGKGNIYWSGWNVISGLLQYAWVTGTNSTIGRRCGAAVVAYMAATQARMANDPFLTWSQNRWQDWVYLVHWALDQDPQGQEQMLWDLGELTWQQSWDWDSYYNQTGIGATGAYVGQSVPRFPEAEVAAWTMWDHGVNNAMGTKSCAVWSRQSHNASDPLQSYIKLDMQDRFHGQPHGMYSADECFGGRHLNRGIELCAVVEQMYSLGIIYQVQGDPYFMDRLERIAFNAWPGTTTDDLWQHQYLQQANEINAMYDTNPHVWATDGDDATGFGVEPNFGCCTEICAWLGLFRLCNYSANMQQGWPKLVNNGLFISVDTNYPFESTAKISLQGSGTLWLRVPGWALNGTLVQDNGPETMLVNGTLHRIVINGSSEVEVDLNPATKMEQGWGRLEQVLPHVNYSVVGVAVPADVGNFSFTNGAALAQSRLEGRTDVRSGDPNETTTVRFATALVGQGHNLSAVNFTFQYVSGYSADNGAVGASFDLQVTDVQGRLLQTLYRSPPLSNYSFDDFSTYSPPNTVVVESLNVDNQEPLYLQLMFYNHDRNLQLLLPMEMRVQWTTASSPSPPSPGPSPLITPGTNAVSFYHGPMLYALPLNYSSSVVKTWEPFGNTDVNLVTEAPWSWVVNVSVPPVHSCQSSLAPKPFDTGHVVCTLQVQARPLASWIAASNAANEPPPSPVDCSLTGACGDEVVTLHLVPYGTTNLRISSFPWTQ